MCINYVFCVVFDCLMTHDGPWSCHTICGRGRPDIARVMQLLADGARLRVVARILYFPPSVVGRLWRSYQDTGEYTRRQGLGRSRMITPQQDSFLFLLSRHNHMSTAKTLEIDICRATEVHFPHQLVRNKLHCDVMRARRPAVRFNFARQHLDLADSSLDDVTLTHSAIAAQCCNHFQVRIRSLDDVDDSDFLIRGSTLHESSFERQ